MRISIIGAGRVATHLAIALFQKDICIHSIYSQTLTNAQRLAKQVQAQPIQALKQLELVDILIIAVSDAQIDHVARQLAENQYQGLTVHTSGSTSLNVLCQYQLRAGVFYPLQTFSLNQKIDWLQTPIFLEASHSSDLSQLHQLADQLSNKIYHYDSQQRLSLHLAAVFACNFSNYCYDIAQQLLQNQQVDPDLLLPLIQGTANKLKQQTAYENQTGPAMRHDDNILQLHQQELQHYAEWLKIYQLMSDAIRHRHK
ncbi:DUF2520 domain-containing protein [Acinetobacter qingfengensis]|uniref:Uncharacterized protein n=1 Tax=Acinetobacter qingfengensis TaxID=1262585 RepID=A0A1E7RDF9_9GAMM|nr:Rossmann-like and DUF2520 domain-containing protein [Acinetobacter qingfengensis]KAA8735331.1 DUF2520 domain-containing protein [Acinetobacter qingfengensis]OEY97449.1 hypothetical protein BJI46_10120 [Acinetobacter qingfengensis]